MKRMYARHTIMAALLTTGAVGISSGLSQPPADDSGAAARALRDYVLSVGQPAAAHIARVRELSEKLGDPDEAPVTQDLIDAMLAASSHSPDIARMALVEWFPDYINSDEVAECLKLQLRAAGVQALSHENVRVRMGAIHFFEASGLMFQDRFVYQLIEWRSHHDPDPEVKRHAFTCIESVQRWRKQHNPPL